MPNSATRPRGGTGLIGKARLTLPFRLFMFGAVAALAWVTVGSASALADEAPWGFEQVTPNGKGAGSVSYVDTFRVAPEGKTLLYTSQAPFESVPTESVPVMTRYVGVREENGWRNIPVDPPFDLSPFDGPKLYQMGTVASSENLKFALVASTVALAPEAIAGGSNLYMRNTLTGEYRLVAAHPDLTLIFYWTTHQGDQTFKYVSPDGNSAIFGSFRALTPGAPDGGPTGAAASYLWESGAGLQAYTMLPAAEGGGIVGGGLPATETQARDYLPRSGAEETLFFSTYVGSSQYIYLREDGQTKLVSRSHRDVDDPTVKLTANLEAISRDSRYAVFISTQLGARLTDNTPAAANRALYRYDSFDDSLTYIGYSTTSELALQELSADGQTVAFSSPEVLAPGATSGATNHYVWNDGDTQFVATSDAGSNATSTASWIRHLSHNGKYFAFTDNSASLSAQFGYDSMSVSCGMFGMPGACDQVYLYDVEADELSCASCNPDGSEPAGKSGDPGTDNSGYMRLDGHAPQFVADDGTVFFTTLEGLLRSDTNGALDVYAFKSGELRLVTRARQGVTYARLIEVAPDGKSVFIASNDRLAATDTDSSVDIYRTGPDAGFDFEPQPTLPECQGVDCRQPSDPPGLPVIGTVNLGGSGNVTAGSSAPSRRVRVGRLKPAKGSKAALKLRVPAAGRLVVRGASIRNRSRAVAKAGSYSIPVVLNRRAKRQLKRKNRLKVTVKVVYRQREGGSSSKALRLTFKSGQRSGGRSGS